MLVRELTLYKVVFRHVQCHSELILKVTRCQKQQESHSGDEGDDIPLHGAINEEEAKEYSSSLDNIVIKLGIDIKEEVKDAMKGAIIEYKEVMTKMVPGIDTADPDAVWRAIKDKVGCASAHLQKKRKGH